MTLGKNTIGGTLFWAVTAFDVIACSFLLWFFSFYLSGTLPWASMYEGEKTYIASPELELTPASNYYRSRLDPTRQSTYDAIERGFRSLSKRLVVSSDAEEGALQELCQAVLADNPDIFWADTKIGYHSDGDGNYILELFYILNDPDYIQEEHTKFGEMARLFADEHVGSRPLVTLIDAHDIVCQTAEYDVNFADQSMYSVFEERASVCAGYSRAIQFLCQAAGVPCIYVPGTAGLGEAPSEAHAWNVALIDGSVCYVDATWDDKAEKTSRPWMTLDGERFGMSHHPEKGEDFYEDLANVSRGTNCPELTLELTPSAVKQALS